jgi:hypothetical protein
MRLASANRLIRFASRCVPVFVPVLAIVVGFSADAHAHIQLTSPPARFAYNAAGIKIGPCGAGTATNMVTHLTPGQSLNVMFNETVPHPGFFRISLDTTGADTFPPISPTPESPVLAPVLADNVLFHAAAGSGGPQMFTVTVPNASCAKCTLQLTQFMSDNPTSGYYQCADVVIDSSADGGTGAGGSPAGTGGGSGGGGMGGCSYAGGRPGGAAAAAALTLALLGLLFARGRRVRQPTCASRPRACARDLDDDVE